MEHEKDGREASEEVTGEIEPVPGAAAWTDPDPTWQYEAAAPVGPPAGDVARHGLATGSPVFGQLPPPGVPESGDPSRGYAGLGTHPAAPYGWPGTQPAPSGWHPYPQSGWYAPPPPPPSAMATATYGSPPERERSKSRRRVMRVGTAIFVVGATLAAGIGVGHLVWRPAASTTASGTTPTTSTPATSSPATGNGGSNGATSPGGTAGSTGSPFGTSPFFPGGLNNPSSNSTGTGGSNSSATGSPSNVSSIAGKVDPGLVDIDTVIDYGEGEAAGTGIVLTSNGEILTNNHVIDGSTSISVHDIGNGQTYKATVVGYDRTDDVSVIQLENASGLQTANIGDSSSVTVGEGVVAIGNAGGVGGTPSAAGGSVTSLNQTITASDEGGGNQETLHGMIEINSDIQPGDSGGSLVNSSGQVIGMDTAASSGLAFASSSTQGYAIPINTATSLAAEIVAGQSSSSIHLGASGFMGVEVDPNYSGSGAEITGTLSGSPAAGTSLGSGDVITAVNGQSVSTADALTNLMTQFHPGDHITLSWTDSSGNQQSTSLTLTTGPAA
jgi:S1-C subfamily serine protease